MMAMRIGFILQALHIGARLGKGLAGGLAGLVEPAAEAEAGGAGVEPGAHVVGLDPADGEDRHIAGDHRQLRLQHGGRRGFGREQLQRRCSGADGGEGLRRGEIAGAGDEAGRSRGGDDLGIRIGRNDDPAAGSRERAPTSSGFSTVPAPTSVRSPKRFASRSMLSSGSGELSGTSMIRMPPSIDRIADRFGLVRA